MNQPQLMVSTPIRVPPYVLSDMSLGAINVPPNCHATFNELTARVRLSAFVRQQAQNITRLTGINFEESEFAPETYAGVVDGFKEAIRTGRPVLVSSENSDHSIYTHASDNWSFRFWHDYLHFKYELRFSFIDELLTGQHQVDAVAAEFGVDSLEAKLMTADTLGQVLHFKTHGVHVQDQLAFARSFLRTH